MQRETPNLGVTVEEISNEEEGREMGRLDSERGEKELKDEALHVGQG